jgi:hypothetical protein
MLEFDHILPVARGGESTADNLRLRCRAHNQYEAERTFGAEFMRQKREARQARNGTAKRAEDPDRDVAPWLRTLGFKSEDVKRGVALSEAEPNAPLETRVRLALSGLRGGRRPPASSASLAAPEARC